MLNTARAAGAILLLSLAAGCADFEPMPLHSPSELPTGPGLFTGKRGEFVILGPTEEERRGQKPPSTPAPRDATAPVPQPAP